MAQRRRLGQVFTPRRVADWMAHWVCGHRPRRILDPAVGHGVFVEAVEALLADVALTTAPRIDGCEIDAGMLQRFASAHRSTLIHCRETDFITACFRGKYDAVIANPPYVRHHGMRYDDAVFSGFDRICRRRLSRMTNLYGLFLIKIWTLLAEKGRAAVITPAEWLNADFGASVKAYFLEENAIDAIVHFDPTANIFDGALTTAAITLLRRSRKTDTPIRLCYVRSAKALSASNLTKGRPFAPVDLDPRVKWTPLFSARRVACLHGRSHTGPRVRTLADVARCTRGIATGANDFFTLRESDRRRWRIDLRDLEFCITKAQQITGDTFTRAGLKRLIEADQRIYLLRPRPRLTVAVKRYLDEGRRRGVDVRYLPSHRPVWYMPEHRRPAPILVSVFARGAFRFVLNKAGVLNLTAYHAIYPRTPNRARIRALFEYLCSSEVDGALRQHRRIYADGLLKLEPRDMEALTIPYDIYRSCVPH